MCGCGCVCECGWVGGWVNMFLRISPSNMYTHKTCKNSATSLTHISTVYKCACVCASVCMCVLVNKSVLSTIRTSKQRHTDLFMSASVNLSARTTRLTLTAAGGAFSRIAYIHSQPVITQAI